MSQQKQTIPVVDLEHFTQGSAQQQAHFVQTLGDALVKYGFVAVENHGVDQTALRQTYAAMKAFFALPTATKQAYEDRDGGNQRGYTAMGREHAKDSTVSDLKSLACWA